MDRDAKSAKKTRIERGIDNDGIDCSRAISPPIWRARYYSGMNMPMFGSWQVQVKEVKPFAIHGDAYLELHVVRANDEHGDVLSLKVPAHATKGLAVKPGDRVSISFLAGQVTAVRSVTPERLP